MKEVNEWNETDFVNYFSYLYYKKLGVNPWIPRYYVYYNGKRVKKYVVDVNNVIEILGSKSKLKKYITFMILFMTSRDNIVRRNPDYNFVFCTKCNDSIKVFNNPSVYISSNNTGIAERII